MDIGCAPLLCCDPDVDPQALDPNPLNELALVSMAVSGRASLPDVDRKVDVRFDVGALRGAPLRGEAVMSMGVVRLPMSGC